MRRIGLLALLILTPSLALAGTRTVAWTGQPIVVNLQRLQPTAVAFPEPITELVTGADPKTLSLEQVGPRLFLQPLVPDARGVLFALGESGRSYTVRFQVAEPADTEVVVQAPLPPGAPPPAPAAPRADDTGGVTVGRLLKAMMRRSPLPGVEEAPDHQVLLDEDGLRLTTTWVYVAPPYRGYVAEAENRAKEPRPLLLPRYFVRGLRAIAADQEVLPPGGKTRVFLVFWPGGR